jgi:hypothetical protein
VFTTLSHEMEDGVKKSCKINDLRELKQQHDVLTCELFMSDKIYIMFVREYKDMVLSLISVSNL